MAAACSEGNIDLDENLLVCGICSERYKNAKLLPCWHSFCEECLHKLIEISNGLTCPYCRRSHDVPEGGVSDLAGNDFLNDMVKSCSGPENVTGMQKSTCQACDEGRANKICVDCPLTLCSTCGSAHTRIPATKNHRLVTLEEYQSSYKDSISKCTSPRCKIHPDNREKFYCDSCHLLCCAECIMAAHREHTHKVKDLQTAADEWTELLNCNLQKMGFKEKKTAGLKKTLREMIKADEELYEKGENKIKEYTQRTLDLVRKKIEDNEKVLLEELKQIHNSNKTTLNAKIKELDCIESDSSSVKEFVEAVKHHGNATHLMSVRKSLTSRIEELFSFYDDVSQIEPCNIFKFSPRGDFLEGKLGEVAIDQFQVKEIPEFVRVGDEINIKLVTVSQQQKLNVSEEDIQVDVTSSTDETVATMVTRNEDGTFSITWQATTEGLYNVSTSVLGKPTGTVAVIKIVPKKGLLHVFKEDKKGAFVCFWGVTMLRDDVIMVCDSRIVLLGMGDQNEITEPAFSLPKPFKPLYSAVSGNGSILITRKKEVALIKGKDVRFFGKGIIEEAVGIAFHQLNSCIYVVDNGASCVRVFSQDGVYISSFGREYLKKPRCVCINNDGDVMVSDEGKNNIQVYKADGQFQNTFSSNLSLRAPEGIAIDKYGYVYICDHGKGRVLKVDSRGKLISCIAKVEQPMGVCVTNDTPPRVIVADNVESLTVVRVFAQ